MEDTPKDAMAKTIPEPHTVILPHMKLIDTDSDEVNARSSENSSFESERLTS